jgi:hypothetical protein
MKVKGSDGSLSFRTRTEMIRLNEIFETGFIAKTVAVPDIPSCRDSGGTSSGMAILTAST